jgi:hypothetical protein
MVEDTRKEINIYSVNRRVDYYREEWLTHLNSKDKDELSKCKLC